MTQTLQTEVLQYLKVYLLPSTKGRMVVVEAPQFTAYNEGCSICWSEGYGALAVLSKCKFLSRIMTLSVLSEY